MRDGKGKGAWNWLRPRLPPALYAMVAMYLFFMILDRALSLIFGYNFQPYGASVPPGFTVWGHLFNGSTAILGIWIWLELLELAGRGRYSWALRAAVTAAALFLPFWIPYSNDAEHLIKHGSGGAIPAYVLANAAYVTLAGIVTLRLFKSKKSRIVFLLVLLAAFLLVHFILYAPRFPEFQWT